MHAGVLTVSNNPNSPGQYSDITSATSAANARDTLLVAGSNTSYGSVTINTKEIHIIGAGYNPNKNVAHATKFGYVTFGATGTGGAENAAAGSSIQGGGKYNY